MISMTSSFCTVRAIFLGQMPFASVHPTRDIEATETNDLNKIEFLNTTP
jgi:hypothetical protein